MRASIQKKKRPVLTYSVGDAFLFIKDLEEKHREEKEELEAFLKIAEDELAEKHRAEKKALEMRKKRLEDGLVQGHKVEMTRLKYGLKATKKALETAVNLGIASKDNLTRHCNLASRSTVPSVTNCKPEDICVACSELTCATCEEGKECRICHRRYCNSCWLKMMDGATKDGFFANGCCCRWIRRDDGANV